LKVLQFCNEDRATSWQRSQAFKALGVELVILFHSKNEENFPFFKSLLHSVFHRFRFPLERNDENSIIISTIKSQKFDIVFIEKCLTLKSSTLKKIKNLSPDSKLICYILDDFLGRGNSSVYFEKCVPLFDLIATNKLHNVDAFKNLNARKVFYFKNAYSEIIHKPVSLNSSDSQLYTADVSFIGTYEKDRAEKLMYLARNGIRITVWGWTRNSINGEIDHPNIKNMERYAYLDEFTKVMCGSKICLNFLRKANRDTETTRSVEIPACGSFMLAERTESHQILFEEGKEAEYFSTNEEMLKKVQFYLNQNELRQKIGLEGYNRCLISGYGYEVQLNQILKKVQTNE
jgi:spore maturation protein CgeB